MVGQRSSRRRRSRLVWLTVVPVVLIGGLWVWSGRSETVKAGRLGLEPIALRDGTAPFDPDGGPGFDVADDDGIVRAGDLVVQRWRVALVGVDTELPSNVVLHLAVDAPLDAPVTIEERPETCLSSSAFDPVELTCDLGPLGAGQERIVEVRLRVANGADDGATFRTKQGVNGYDPDGREVFSSATAEDIEYTVTSSSEVAPISDGVLSERAVGGRVEGTDVVHPGWEVVHDLGLVADRWVGSSLPPSGRLTVTFQGVRGVVIGCDDDGWTCTTTADGASAVFVGADLEAEPPSNGPAVLTRTGLHVWYSGEDLARAVNPFWVTGQPLPSGPLTLGLCVTGSSDTGSPDRGSCVERSLELRATANLDGTTSFVLAPPSPAPTLFPLVEFTPELSAALNEMFDGAFAATEMPSVAPTGPVVEPVAVHRGTRVGIDQSSAAAGSAGPPVSPVRSPGPPSGSAGKAIPFAVVAAIAGGAGGLVTLVVRRRLTLIEVEEYIDLTELDLTSDRLVRSR